MRPAHSVRGAASADGRWRCARAAYAGLRAGRRARGHAQPVHTGVRVRASQLRYVTYTNHPHHNIHTFEAALYKLTLQHNT